MADTGHRIFGGSRSHYWKCERAYADSRGKPVQAAGAAAERGTRLHGVYETATTAWSMGVDAEHCVPTNGLTDGEHAGLVVAVTQTAAIVGEGARGSVICEAFVPIAQGLGFAAGSRFDNLAAGSADLIAYDETQARAVVCDYKAGTQEVLATSPQLLLYAAGATASVLAGKRIERLDLAIVQDGREPSVRSIDAQQMREEFEGYRAHLINAVTNPRRHNPGTHCTWCPARGDCRAHADHLMGEFVDHADVTGMADAELVRWFTRAKPIETFIEHVRDELTRRATAQGSAPEGTKWVRQIVRRRWSDEAALLELAESAGVADTLAPRKALSPSAALDALPEMADALAPLITKPEGAPALAPASDRRKSVGLDADAVAALLDESVLFTD